MGEPVDVTVRAATLDDVDQMSRVFVDTFRASHRGQMPESLLLKRTYETSARGWDHALREIAASDDPASDTPSSSSDRDTRAATGFYGERVWVAVDGAGGVVGLAMGGPPKPWPADDPVRRQRPTGECYVLYVDVPRQRGGVGRALLGELAAFLASRGVRRMLVAVLAVNEPARAFYRSVGGVLLGERDFDDSGVQLDEVVYVWDDLTRLCEGAPKQ